MQSASITTRGYNTGITTSGCLWWGWPSVSTLPECKASHFVRGSQRKSHHKAPQQRVDKSPNSILKRARFESFDRALYVVHMEVLCLYSYEDTEDPGTGGTLWIIPLWPAVPQDPSDSSRGYPAGPTPRSSQAAVITHEKYAPFHTKHGLKFWGAHCFKCCPCAAGKCHVMSGAPEIARTPWSHIHFSFIFSRRSLVTCSTAENQASATSAVTKDTQGSVWPGATSTTKWCQLRKISTQKILKTWRQKQRQQPHHSQQNHRKSQLVAHLFLLSFKSCTPVKTVSVPEL